MWKPLVLSVATGMTFAAPAFAATTWYVAQNVKTMNCIVTPTKPNGTTYMMVGTMTFTAVAAATKEMRAEAACKVATTVAVKTTAPTTTAATTPKPPTATPTPNPAPAPY
jgi:hypothetical protein